MAESFEATECFGIAEFRFEMDNRARTLYEPALAWNAKFFAVVALDSRNDFERQLLHVKKIKNVILNEVKNPVTFSRNYWVHHASRSG